MTSTESDQRAEDQGGVVVPMRRLAAGDDQWEPWVGERAVSMHYDVSTRTVRRWRAGGMPSRVFGGVRRYRLSECDDWHRRRGVA